MKGLGASFGCAFKGIISVWRTERNMKIHLAAAVLALVLGGFLRLSWQEFLFVGMAIALVMMAEAFNTAIETVVDLVSPEHNQLAGRAKDIAAGAVLLAAIFALVVGLVVFGRRLF